MLRFLIKISNYYNRSSGAEQTDKKGESSSSAVVDAEKTHQAK